MKTERTSRALWCYLGTALVFLTLWLVSSVATVEAQTTCPSAKGNNAVWGVCPGKQLEIVGTTALIDASAWCNGSCNLIDFCLTLNSALSAVQNNISLAQGAVVDARGVVYSDGGGETCTINPFAGITVPSTVLLPASEIDIRETWVLPSNTRISGQGRRTILLATSTFTAGGPGLRAG